MWKPIRLFPLLTAALAPALLAQTPQPPRPGIGVVHLGPGPYTLDTAEQHKLKVTVIARGLQHPFGIAFLPNGDALILERGAGLRIIHDATGPHPQLDPEAVRGVPMFVKARVKLDH